MTGSVNNILGQGIAFPLNSSESGGLAYSNDIDRINQSLYIIFNTPKGTRLMLPEFGSNIHQYKFDPLDSILMEKLKYTITDDIRRWEPRILLTNVEFLTDPAYIDNNILYISLSYTVINTSVQANFVYPYKLGTYDSSNQLYN